MFVSKSKRFKLQGGGVEIVTSENAARFFRSKMDAEVEEFWIVGLSSSKTIISAKCLFRGTVDSCLVHPRDIIRFSCLTNSSTVIISHNHPSGDPTPSLHDIRLTHKLQRIGRLVQIPVLDHIIVTRHSFTSFRENKWFKRSLAQ
jgi:DNA repair protein RadC